MLSRRSGERPSEVKIGAVRWKILWSESSWKRYATAEQMEQNVGLTQIGATRILIGGYETHLSEVQLRDTLLHEILHAILATTPFSYEAMGLPENRYDLEELIVTLMTPGLLTVLNDNPKVAKYLCG